jgi:hypothetical protein
MWRRQSCLPRRHSCRRNKFLITVAARRENCGFAIDVRARGGGSPCANLLEYSALKTAAEKVGIEAIDRRHTMLSVKFHPQTHIEQARLMNRVRAVRGAQFTPAGVLILPIEGATAPGDILHFLKERLEQLQA